MNYKNDNLNFKWRKLPSGYNGNKKMKTLWMMNTLRRDKIRREDELLENLLSELRLLR